MKKVAIQFEETIRYDGEIIVIQPDGMSDEDFDMLLNKAERQIKRMNEGAKEFVYTLTQLGLKVEKQSYSFPNSPRDSEFEIFNVYDKK